MVIMLTISDRKNKYLIKRMDEVDHRIDGLKSLVFYTLMDYKVPKGGTVVIDAQMAKVLGGLKTAEDSLLELQEKLRKLSKAPRPKARRREIKLTILPAVRGSQPALFMFPAVRGSKVVRP